jgi:Tfp pilus assembly protein PilF
MMPLRNRLAAALSAVDRRWLALYVVAIGLLALATHVATPIVSWDSDLWYHLSHGRYLFEEGTPPTTRYFSFLDPESVWIDYYWLFQALVYSVHEVLGFGGLVALRGLLYGLLLIGLGYFVLRYGKRGQGLWLGVVYGLAVVHTFGRFLNLRPHCFSYLLLVVFLLLLENRSRWVWLMPLLAALWVNLHGVEFPVMLLICGAYGMELLLTWWRNGALAEAERRTLAAAALSMGAVAINPAGLGMLMVPFKSLYFISALIMELRPRDLDSFLTFSLGSDGLSSMTAANLLLLCAILAAVTGACRGRLRTSHLLLCIGAVILAPRAIRFSNEMALLLIPLLVAQAPWPPLRCSLSDRRWTFSAATALMGLLLLAPIPHLLSRWPDKAQSFPLSIKNLPHGAAAFLSTQTRGGRIMNGPNHGGYLAWMLYPHHRIFANMEIPFIFSQQDIYDVLSAFASAPALARFLERYRPDFITAEYTTPRFAELIAAHPQYRLVFFDDVYLLYADATRHAELVSRFELKVVDPIRLAEQRLTTLGSAERAAMRAELERIEAIDPRMVSVGKALAILDNVDGDFDRALVRLERILSKEPTLETIHVLRGDALRGRGDLPSAIRSYRQALRQARDAEQRPPIQKSLASTLSQAGKHDGAFDVLERAVLARPLETPAADYFELAIYAARVGELDRAREYLDRAALKTPSTESELARRIEAAQRRIDAASE